MSMNSHEQAWLGVKIAFLTFMGILIFVMLVGSCDEAAAGELRRMYYGYKHVEAPTYEPPSIQDTLYVYDITPLPRDNSGSCKEHMKYINLLKAHTERRIQETGDAETYRVAVEAIERATCHE